MVQQYTYNSKVGGYRLVQHESIVICRFYGVCSDNLARHYLADMTKLAKRLSAKPWAYVVDAIDHQAAIPSAEPLLKQAYQVCKQHQCVSDAYCMGTALSASQLEKIRRRCGVTDPIATRTFDDVETALVYLSQDLEKHLHNTIH